MSRQAFPVTRTVSRSQCARADSVAAACRQRSMSLHRMRWTFRARRRFSPTPGSVRDCGECVTDSRCGWKSPCTSCRQARFGRRWKGRATVSFACHPSGAGLPMPTRLAVPCRPAKRGAVDCARAAAARTGVPEKRTLAVHSKRVRRCRRGRAMDDARVRTVASANLGAQAGCRCRNRTVVRTIRYLVDVHQRDAPRGRKDDSDPTRARCGRRRHPVNDLNASRRNPCQLQNQS